MEDSSQSSLVNIGSLFGSVANISRIQRDNPNKNGLTHDDIFNISKNRAERYNKTQGKETDYDCKKCMNRGDFMCVEEGRNGMIYEKLYPCSCQATRKSIRRAKASGMFANLSRMRFDNFNADQQFQKGMVDIAKRYAEIGRDSWFYIGGAVGCGKTHICTAIVRELIYGGKNVYYEPWLTLSLKLKSSQYGDTVTYANELHRVQTVDVLYIDDFFKPTRAEESRPTSADISVAYEIINYRYINRLPMLISSEWQVEQIISFDEATGSRIYQMSKGYTIGIDSAPNRNYRMSD